MQPDRRTYWQEVETESLAAARDTAKPEGRRRGSAVFAGQAACLLGRPAGDNPFPAGTLLFDRWAQGWDVGVRRGDPLDQPDTPPAAAAGERKPPRRKFSRPAATHAAHTHPED